MAENSKEFTYGFFINNEPVDKLPQWARDSLSKRLSVAVSLYFK